MYSATLIKQETMQTHASENRTTSLSVGISALAAMSDAVNALIMAPATACLTFGSARTATCNMKKINCNHWTRGLALRKYEIRGIGNAAATLDSRQINVTVSLSLS